MKNVFFFFLRDSYFWVEIEKLFDLGFIGFSSNFIFEGNSIFNTSFLSIILLDLYFFEFDKFLLNFSFKFTSFKAILSCPIFHKQFFDLYFPKSYFSLKFEPTSLIQTNLNSFYLYRFQNSYFFNFQENFVFPYVKSFNFCRYKDQFLIGFVSSRKFVFIVKNKCRFFIKSLMGFSLINFIISENNLFFLGFNINIFFPTISKTFQSNKNLGRLSFFAFSNEILVRLNLFKKRFFNFFFHRIKYELITSFFRKRKLLGLNSKYKLDYKFWSYFFQLESFRSFSYYVLIFTDDVWF